MDHMFHEFEMKYHDKSNHGIYKIVPQIMQAVLHEYPEIAGFVIGGSYANGQYQSGDDIDTDLIFDEYPDSWQRKLNIEKEIRQKFMQEKLMLYIRLSVATGTIPSKDRLETYSEHPNSPYVVRNNGVAKAWGLEK